MKSLGMFLINIKKKICLISSKFKLVIKYTIELSPNGRRKIAREKVVFDVSYISLITR